MTRLVRIFVILLSLIPAAVFGQGYKDLDAALAAVSRGFERGETQAIVSGIGDGDQVMLQFPGLVDDSGFFGRDQAAYLLDDLFRKARPTGFEQVSARRVSAEGQYHITANWTVSRGGKEEKRELYITLRKKDDRWAVASVRSGR
jgi:hypothetical protein